MVSPVIVMADELIDLPFKVARQIVIFQQDPVLQGLMPTLDLALGLRVVRCPANMLHARFSHPVGEITGDVACAIVG